MSSKIQIKRGLKSKLPTLSNGEFGLCNDTNQVYIGNNNNVEVLTEHSEKFTSINKKIELNIKDYGAKGDGITDDTKAFEDIFSYIKTLQTDKQYDRGIIIKLPYGIYNISKGFEIDVNVGLVGEANIKTVTMRNFGENAYQQDMSPNCTTIRFNNVKSNTTMFKPIFSSDETEGSQYHKDFYLRDLMLDGRDGQVVSTTNPTGKGTKDIIINFTGLNCNGLDLSNIRFLKGTDNVSIVGFSGYGIKTYHWQQHNNININVCGTGVISGGDGAINNPIIAFCKNGIQIGDTNLVGATDRINNARIEWCEEYGINVINGGNNRISGFIDRCGYSGYCQSVDTWGMNVDLTIQRCGCVWRGGTIADLTTKELKKQGSNSYINNARGGNFRFTNLKSGSRDTSESADIKAPIISTSLIGSTDYILTDSPQGFSNTFHTDYYLEGNSNGTIISNGKIHSDYGIKIDTNTNKSYIDIFNGYRFRPPTNWGKPADSIGVSGDIMFDSQNNKMYYKNATTWIEM